MYWLMEALKSNINRPDNPKDVDWSKHYPKVYGLPITEELNINS